MAQAVSRRLFIAKVRVRSQPSLCEFSGEQSGTGTGFFARVFHFSPSCTIPKMLHNLPVHVAFTRGSKGRSLRIFWKAMLCFGNRGRMDKEVLLLLLAYQGLRSSRERLYIHSRKLWTAVNENMRCKKFAVCTHCLRVTRRI